MLHSFNSDSFICKQLLKEAILMHRIYYSYSKNTPAKGYVYGLKCDNRFYVIQKRAYRRIQKKLKRKKPVFQTDLPVYIDGINI